MRNAGSAAPIHRTACPQAQLAYRLGKSLLRVAGQVAPRAHRHLRHDDATQLLEVWGQGVAPPTFSEEVQVLSRRLDSAQQGSPQLSYC
ncbi:hypothetical protein FSY45_24475 [Comamonas sp. Z1]|nr:hypothetical protein [Pseudomonas sp.]PTT41521.1 hypothetical protein DBR23_05810 [Acidovorax sp. HMWF018]TYK70969.1 hypothetical protein FSY45_24475 [Comamonas sp. Z1]